MRGGILLFGEGCGSELMIVFASAATFISISSLRRIVKED